MMRLAGRAHGFQDGDLSLLLRHDHRQGADNIKGGHDGDQDQQQKHHGLFQFQRGKQIAV